MANSKTLFSQPDVKNNPHRSGFDLSKRKLFTAKVGELLPVYCRSVIPGDHFKFSAQSFTRTQPVQTSAFTRIQEYVDFFFVPYRILWRNFPASFTQMQDAKNIAQSLSKTQSINDMLPYVTMGDLLKCICSNLPLQGETNVGPAYTTLDEVGANKKQSIFKLLSYLGYGDFDRFGSNTGLNASSAIPNTLNLEQYFDTSKKLSLLPLLAYQKIYFDFFRNTQWEEDRAQAHNVDYMTESTNIADYDSKPNNLEDLFNSGILSLRYANYAKDLLLGLLPNAQFGDVAEITLSSSSTYGFIPQGAILSNGTKVVDKQSQPLVSNDVINGGKFSVLAGSPNSEIKTDTIRTTSDVSVAFDKINSAFNALDIRNLMATQRWREIANTGDRTYRSQIEKHFGVTLPQMLENNCVYIDGWKGSVAINEVVNTNLQSTSDDDSPKATIEGKGVGDIDGHDFDFDVKEHGLILGIYHAVPIMDYSLSAPTRDNQIVNISDMFIPEYDKLGYESVLPTDFFQITQKRFNVPLIVSQLGYAPRYWQYKTDVDEVVGAFRTSLVDWCAPFDDSYLKNSITLISGNNYKLDYRFFKVNASILDDIFGVNAHLSYYDDDITNNLGSLEIDNDQLLIALDFTIYANRNMDFNGLPY